MSKNKEKKTTKKVERKKVVKDDGKKERKKEKIRKNKKERKKEKRKKVWSQSDRNIKVHFTLFLWEIWSEAKDKLPSFRKIFVP